MSGKDLNAAVNAIAVAEIQKTGDKMIIPEGMTAKQALELLQRRIAYEEEKVNVIETIDCFPWDGAVALHRVLSERYGWAQAVPTPGFFGPEPPTMMNIDVDYDKKMMVPWGRFKVPDIAGVLETAMNRVDGRLVFMMKAVTLRKDENTVKMLFDKVRQEFNKNSIYRGKAIKMRFRDEDGDQLPMPEPRFIDTDSIDDNMAVYSEAVERAIRTNLFTPITRAKDCISNGIALKRGILLGGTFGTGKTLAASVASKYAVESGITYIYVPRADELADAIAFAKQYQSPACVVFCEDIDRSMSGERSVKMDDILNIIDGIDTKTANIITVLTTNDLKSINPAMLRPGRLDCVVEVTTPDAKACEKLLRLYSKGAISPDTDLTAAGKALDGSIPAVVAEVVKRAVLAQLAREPRGSLVRNLGELAVLEAAQTIAAQVKLMNKCIADADEVAPTFERAFVELIQKATGMDPDQAHAINVTNKLIKGVLK